MYNLSVVQDSPTNAWPEASLCPIILDAVKRNDVQEVHMEQTLSVMTSTPCSHVSLVDTGCDV